MLTREELVDILHKFWIQAHGDAIKRHSTPLEVMEGRCPFGAYGKLNQCHSFCGAIWPELVIEREVGLLNEKSTAECPCHYFDDAYKALENLLNKEAP